MQNSVPKGGRGNDCNSGTTVENIENILQENQNNFKAEIANDNSEGQMVLSGKIKDLENLSFLLKKLKIKNVRLPVSAPFHCSLMSKATEIMKKELEKLKFKKGTNPLISNITADEIFNADELKNLLIKQIENKVRWRESVINMINKGANQFIEIGPGKVLSGLVKRINKEVYVSSINSEEEIKKIKNMKDLEKNIIITGASGGIGNSIVKKFYEHGANILASGTKIEKLEELKKRYDKIKILSFDISQIEKIEQFIDNAANELGGLDCVINNAGITQDNLAIRMNIEEWKK